MIILIGTKGQFIKMAPIMWELDKRKWIRYRYIQADQHPKLNAKLEKLFNIKRPELCLNSDMNPICLISFFDTMKWWIRCIREAFKNKKWIQHWKLIVIHGDTMSTLLGLIIGKLFHMKIAHIESGLRSYSILHPFPEEIIRRLACKFSDILFAPGDWAVHNLRTERARIVNTHQNTIFDVLRTIKFKQIPETATIPYPYIVATIHRQETLYNYLLLRKALITVHKANKIARVKFILHPLTKQKLIEYNYLDGLIDDNIELLDVLLYPDFMELVKGSLFVITDGGGLQEETYYLNKPCLLLRKRTERQIGLDSTACLSEFDDNIIDYFLEHYQTFKRKRDFVRYNPSKIIVDYLEKENKRYVEKR